MRDESSKSELLTIYLHGFASGPKSSKAVFFSKKLNDLGVETVVPDLALPSFETMTLSSQLKIVQELTCSIDKERPILVIGSSMGGLLAAMASNSIRNLAALILLAPAFGLTKRWPLLLQDETLQSWQRNGHINVFNYAVNKKMPLSYKFFEDAALHETENITVAVPTLMFHGQRDETVPLQASQRFALKNQPYTYLHVLDDDHQLLSSLEYMWEETSAFLSSLLEETSPVYRLPPGNQLP